MKIERISDNIIKVTISMNDLEERNIDLNSLNYNSPAAQELFWDMMEQAEVQLGFDVSDSQLIIEPLPESNDGFIITITRLDDEGDFESIQKYIKSRFKKSDVRLRKKSRRILSAIMIYSFSSFEDLCALNKNMYSSYSGDSSLYKYKNTYYLVLTRSNFDIISTKTFESIISEYGTKVSNVGFFEGFLNEHGTIIIEHDALQVINDYF